MPPTSKSSKPFGLLFMAIGFFFVAQAVRMSFEEREGLAPTGPGLFSHEEVPRNRRDFQTLLYDTSTWAFTRAELARVDDHIGEMSRVGFRPILPADISHFTTLGEPLPPNAVLVLFSGLDPAQLQLVHDIMARRKWPFAAAANLKGIASAPLQETMNRLAGPSWEMGLRLETTTAAADRDVWHSLDPRLYRCKFAHRAFPAAPLEMAPLAPIVFGGMDAAYSNGHMPPAAFNCLSVRPGWIGRDLVGRLLSERGSSESGSGRGGMGWFGRSGVSGAEASLLTLSADAAGVPAEISPALPEEKGRQCAAFEFEDDPAGVSLLFGAENTTPSAVLRFDPGGRMICTTLAPGLAEPAVARGETTSATGKTRVEIFASNGAWWVIVNGAPFPEVPLPLTGGWGGAPFSVRLAPPASGVARVRFRAVLRKDLAEKFNPPAPRSTPPEPGVAPPAPAPEPAGEPALPEEAPAVKTPDSLRVEAEAALAAGRTTDALRAFAEWWATAPADVRPSERIAEVLIRLGHKTEALDFLRQALELDPTRESLALRLNDLLQELGRAEEARTLLNDYVRLFPESPALLLAQADWLRGKGRMAEATDRAARALELDPANLRALLLLLAGQPAPEQRRANTARLLELARTPALQRDFLDAVAEGGLFSLPGPEPLWTAVGEVSAAQQDEALAGRMKALLPAPASVPRGVADGVLAPEWELRDAESAAAANGALDLRAKPGLREFSLRMRPSAQWLDGFVEAEVDALTGGLWLVARKSVDHVVRFGFDRQESRIFLQTWTGGGRTLLANQRFDLPDGFFATNHVYRLECRGRGVQALLDGVPLARVPEALPAPWEGGAFGLVCRADEPGAARASLRRLACASVAPRIAVVPGLLGDAGEEIPPDRARALASASSILSPLLFTLSADGTIASGPGPADNFVRLLARYHKLHFMPGVTCTNAAPPAAEVLAELAAVHAADGFVLHLASAPDDAWLAAARDAFLTRGLGLVCVLRSPGAAGATLHANFGPGVERPVLSARVLEGLDAPPPADPLEPALLIVKEEP